MAKSPAHIAGEISNWPTKDELARILRSAGIDVYVGTYSLRVNDCSHFVFEQFGADFGDPVISADADCLEDMLRDGKLVSDALSDAGFRHRFEIYEESNEIVGYLHHQWPNGDDA